MQSRDAFEDYLGEIVEIVCIISRVENQIKSKWNWNYLQWGTCTVRAKKVKKSVNSKIIKKLWTMNYYEKKSEEIWQTSTILINW